MKIECQEESRPEDLPALFYNHPFGSPYASSRNGLSSPFFLPVQDIDFSRWEWEIGEILKKKEWKESAKYGWIPLLLNEQLQLVDGLHRFCAWLNGAYGVVDGNDPIQVQVITVKREKQFTFDDLPRAPGYPSDDD